MVKDKDKMVVEHTRPMGTSAHPADRIHERRDVNTSAILKGMGAIVGAMVFTTVAMYFLFEFEVNRAAKLDAPISAVADSVQSPPSPRLQAAPRQDMDGFRAYEDSILRSGGVADPATGAMRLPIDSAIALLASGNARVAPAAAPAMVDTNGTITPSGEAPAETSIASPDTTRR